jgi:hypothetical protein
VFVCVCVCVCVLCADFVSCYPVKINITFRKCNTSRPHVKMGEVQ